MNDRKILLFALAVVFLCLYNVHKWFNTEVNKEKPLISKHSNLKTNKAEVANTINNSNTNVRKKIIPLFIKDACSVLEVFTEKPQKNMDVQNHIITVAGLGLFIIVLLLNALFDVLKEHEKEERAMAELNPDGGKRESLAEFANKKMIRRESSKLFQISETVITSNEQKFVGEMNETKIKNSASSSISDTPMEHKLSNGESVSKSIGARPAPMVRRSSFPALPLQPEIQAPMMNNRQFSFDGDKETEKKPRRVRILRRF